MAAIVIVIISSGIFAKPITPKINSDGITFGSTAISAIDADLNMNKKSIKIITKTLVIVFI